MPGLRATARTAADRDLNTHLKRAVGSVRAALDVCGRAARRRNPDAELFREKQDRLARAERLLRSIGHLDGYASDVDIRQEARALCSWLEGRERSGGVTRTRRRGREYQERLAAVLGFLEGRTVNLEDEEPVQQKVEPEAPEQSAEGELWRRAVELARQQGEADNDAYVQTIFLRLAREVSDG